MKPTLVSFSYLNPSLLRRQPLSGAHRPLTSFGSGVPAASTFSESLADADDAALKRLVMKCLLRRHPFGGVSFLFSTFAAINLSTLSTRMPYFMDGTIF